MKKEELEQSIIIAKAKLDRLQNRLLKGWVKVGSKQWIQLIDNIDAAVKDIEVKERELADIIEQERLTDAKRAQDLKDEMAREQQITEATFDNLDADRKRYEEFRRISEELKQTGESYRTWRIRTQGK